MTPSTLSVHRKATRDSVRGATTGRRWGYRGLDVGPTLYVPRALSMASRTREAQEAQEPTSAMPMMHLRLVPYNEWTHIDSLWEGEFMERFMPGSGAKTISENRDQIRSLYQHGRDPYIGMKPLGPFEELGEADDGLDGDVQLLDTEYVRELIPGLEAEQYGSSIQFEVYREEVEEHPKPSDYNPGGIPERSVKEYRLYEGGPVTFPAYEGTSAGLRSITDHILGRPEWLPDDAPSEADAGRAPKVRTGHLDQERRVFTRPQERPVWALPGPTPRKKEKTWQLP